MEIITYIHLFHILFVGSLFLYVGLMKRSNPSLMYPVLLLLGIVIILYHSFKAYKYMKKGKGYSVNLFHIFVVAPTLIYIGYNKEKTNNMYYN